MNLATFGINAIVTTVFLICGPQLMQLWGGAAARPTFQLVVVMLGMSWISTFMGVQACLLNALGRIKFQSKLSLVAALVNLALSIILVRIIGAVGVVLGTMTSYLVFLVAPQTSLVAKIFREMKAEELNSINPHVTPVEDI